MVRAQFVKAMVQRLLLGLLAFLFAVSCRSASTPVDWVSDRGSATPACRQIQHAMGETCVPLNPQRVVTIDPFSLENVLALGIQPVGVSVSSAWLDERQYVRDRLTGVEIVGDLNQPNLEKVLALKPDLILGLVDADTVYAQLSQIAPTVSFNFQGSGQWKEILLHNAESLGKMELADRLLVAYGDRLAELKRLMQKSETASANRFSQMQTVSVLRVTNGGVSPYLSDSFCSSILQDAGLNLIAAPGDELGGLVSVERVHELDADIIFVWSYGYPPTQSLKTQFLLASIKADPIWQQLSAVQQGRIYAVPSYWIGSGILSANAVIDDLFKHLVEGAQTP